MALAHILHEVSNFFIVLLSVSSRTCLAIFIEISLYLTDTEQKNKLARYFETRRMLCSVHMHPRLCLMFVALRSISMKCPTCVVVFTKPSDCTTYTG